MQPTVTSSEWKLPSLHSPSTPQSMSLLWSYFLFFQHFLLPDIICVCVYWLPFPARIQAVCLVCYFVPVPRRVLSRYWLNERLNQLWSVWKCLGPAWGWYVAWIAISRELIFAFTYRRRPCFCDGWESGCRKTHSTSCRKGSWANWREWFSEEGKCSRRVDFYKQVKDRTYASGNRWQMHCPAS